MKKLMNIFIGTLVSLLVAGKVFAVWPPSTSLETTPESIGSVEATKTASGRLNAVVQKLEEDERRLAILLSNLEKDQEALKNRSKATESGEQRARPGQKNSERK